MTEFKSINKHLETKDHVSSKEKNSKGLALIVDDEQDLRWVLSRILKNQGLEVITAANGEEALFKLHNTIPDIILLDIRMPGMDGIEVLKRIKERNIPTPIVMITAYGGDVRSTVQVMKLGAYDYLTKPFDNRELCFIVNRAVENSSLRKEVDALRQQMKGQTSLSQLMGTSPQIQNVIRQVDQVAGTDFSVIIEGETGTGKELIAHAIHKQSRRYKGSFVVVDCGAIPETLIESELFGHEKGAFTGAHHRKKGYFELAHGGTIFLDEISNLPTAAQSKLLRALQERKVYHLGSGKGIDVDVRLVAASNRVLAKEVRSGGFRRDLYHRLNEFKIFLPPLRERKDDIIFLAKRFLKETCWELKKEVPVLSEEAVNRLLIYMWPGNVRELKNIMRRAALLAEDIVGSEHLSLNETRQPFYGAAKDMDAYMGLSLKELVKESVARTEKWAIQHVLRTTEGNKSKAARILKVDYKTLHTKIKYYGINSIESLP